MKRRSPQGRATHVTVPPEPVGITPSEGFTRASRQLIAQQDQHGRPREEVRVEGMGRPRLAMERRRHDPQAEEVQHDLAIGQQVQAQQARALADALSFEQRARAAGALGQPTPGQRFREQQRAAERAYAYPRPR